MNKTITIQDDPNQDVVNCRVVLTTVTNTFTLPDGTVITGDNITATKDVPMTREGMQVVADQLQAQIDDLQARLDDQNALMADADTKLTDLAKQRGTTYTAPVSVGTITRTPPQQIK